MLSKLTMPEPYLFIKQKLINRFFYIHFSVFLVCFFLVQTCVPDSQISNSVKDYIYHHSDSKIFKKADYFKYMRHFSRSAKIFTRTLKNKELNIKQRHYAYNQLAYIHFCLNENILAKEWIDSLEISLKKGYKMDKGASADFFYNKGIYALRSYQPNLAKSNLKSAIRLYNQVYPKQNHIKQVLAHTNYGIVHYQFKENGNIFFYHVGLAYGIIIKNPALWPHRIETELAMANLSIWKRKYSAAKVHGINAAYLAMNQPDINRIIAVRGAVVGARIVAGTSLDSVKIDSAAKIIHREQTQIQHTNDPIHLDLYRYLAVCYLRANDSYNFLNVIYRLEKLEKKWPQLTPYSQHLLGRHYRIKQKYRPAIQKFKKFIENHERDSVINTKILDDNYQDLVNSYLGLGKFDSAFVYFVKNSLLKTRYKNSHLKPSQILSPAIFSKSAVPFWVLQRAGEIFLQNGIAKRDTQSLKLALKAFKICDSLTFVDSPTYDNDIIQNRYEEIGNTVYPGALIAIQHLIQMQPKKANQYIDLTAHYIDRSKSEILFRYLPENLASNYLRKLKLKIESLEAQSRNSEQNRQLAFNYFRLSRIITSRKIVYRFLQARDIQRFILEKESIIQYKVTDTMVYLLYINADTVDFRCLPIARRELIQKINVIYQALSDSDSIPIAKYFQASKQLFDCLIRPIHAQLKKYPNCTIIPDDSLSLIPFEALLVNKAARLDQNTPFLIASHTDLVISYSPSWKVLKANRSKSAKRYLGPTAYFNYGLKKEDLTCAVKDKIILSNLFSNSSFVSFEHKACNKDTFLAKWQSNIYQVIALSLHADANVKNLLDTKIWFGAKGSDPLFAFEIAHTKGCAELVILSACKSATGKIVSGEGTYSLAQSFCQAGATAVMAALWEIDNCDNARVLSRLEYTSDMAKALSNAKRQYLTYNGNSHPSHWAGMIYLH